MAKKDDDGQARRLVREADFLAEVTVELVETDGGWAPYLSVEDAYGKAKR